MTMTTLETSANSLQVPPTDWEDLVRRSAGLLEARGVTTPRYVEKIIHNLHHDGRYMLVAPHLLLAHARPEEGALGNGVSLVSTAQDVALLGDPELPVRLFFTLAATEASAHLELLSHLAEVLVDEASMSELLACGDPERVAQIINPS